MLDMVVQAFHPSTWEVEASESLYISLVFTVITGQLELCSEILS